MGLSKPVFKGQKASRSAAVENAIRAAAEDFATGSGGASHNIDLQPRPTDIIKIKNTSGEAQDRFAVLGLDCPIIDPTDNLTEFKRQVTFKGVTPVAGTHEGRWAILLAPLGVNKIGPAQVSGAAPTQLTYTSSGDAWEGFAEIADGETTLEHSATTGSARILWAEASGITRWGVVRIGEGAGGGAGGTSILAGARIGTTYFCQGTIQNVALDSTITSGGSCYLVQRLRTTETVYEMASGIIYSARLIGFGDPTVFGEDRPVYLVNFPLLDGAALITETSDGTTVVANPTNLIKIAPPLTIVNNGDGSVTLGLMGLTGSMDCDTGVITFTWS